MPWDFKLGGLPRMLPQLEGGYLTPWYLLQPLEGMRQPSDFTFGPGQWAYHPFAVVLRRQGISSMDLCNWQHRAAQEFGGTWWLQLWDSFKPDFERAGFDPFEFSYVGTLISIAPVGLALLPPGPGARPVPRPGSQGGAWTYAGAFNVPAELGGFYASEVTGAIRAELLASQRRILELVERLSTAAD